MALTEETPSAAATRKVTLKSLDGEVFEVEETVALELQTIKQMIEDDCADNGIPLPNVTSKISSKVIEYCKNCCLIALFNNQHVLEAAAYFEIKSLLELTLLLFLLLSKTNSSKYTRMLILETSDNVKFVINGYFIWHSSTLKSIMEKDSSSGQISHYHPNISSEVLQKVIEYCNKHVSYGNTDAMVSPVAIARRFMACLIKEEVLGSSLGADLSTCLLAIIRKNFPWDRASRTFLKALPWQHEFYKLEKSESFCEGILRCI